MTDVADPEELKAQLKSRIAHWQGRIREAEASLAELEKLGSSTAE